MISVYKGNFITWKNKVSGWGLLEFDEVHKGLTPKDLKDLTCDEIFSIYLCQGLNNSRNCIVNTIKVHTNSTVVFSNGKAEIMEGNLDEIYN